MTEYETCAHLAEVHFPLYKRTFSSLPPKNRRAAWAVLALFHEADRLDMQELGGFEQAAQDFLNGARADGFLWEALTDVRQQFALEEEPLREFIAGHISDREKVTYQEFDDLLMYAGQTGGALGLLLLPVCARRNQEKLRHAAVSLGAAIQLTRVLLGVHTDERSKKRLPRQVMMQFGYTEEELESHTVNKAFMNVWGYIAFEAEAYFEEASEELELFPLYSRPAVTGLLAHYRSELGDMRKRLSQA
ncbi:squalene/phytoene synthase family protein [Bacillus velezensis]|uniref:squalene/phytoene synthase family protein n=1 Tax=Bacillus velezensis TaxID=492670 RepID=UPI0018C4A642|nr:squalene/phytoene synthase family protein [Bacillus velezensis]QPK90086.1 squalene/phytoene synthase family protein [Bacillus velezensis]